MYVFFVGSLQSFNAAAAWSVRRIRAAGSWLELRFFMAWCAAAHQWWLLCNWLATPFRLLAEWWRDFKHWTQGRRRRAEWTRLIRAEVAKQKAQPGGFWAGATMRKQVP